MRTITRRRLSKTSGAVLLKLQVLVDKSASPSHKADVLWRRKTNSRPRRAAFADVRSALDKMAHGRKRCMYCEDSLGTDIDHFRPKSLYPEQTFEWDNYFLACSHCNSNEKRTEFPLDASKNALLINPTSDPFPHLAFVPSTGWLAPMTPQGDSTAKVFGLNRREELTLGRLDTWAHLERIVRDVGNAPTPSVKRQLVDQAKRLSFQSVVHQFVRDGLSATPSFVESALAAVLKADRALWSWAL